MLGALVFAVHILLTDTITRRVAPLAVTTASMVVVGVGSVPLVLWELSKQEAPALDTLGRLLGRRDFLEPTLYATLLATVVALSLINRFQRDLPPVRAAILYALEPVWAALLAYGLGQQEIDFWLLLGGSALLGGNLIAELGPRLVALRLRSPARPTG